MTSDPRMSKIQSKPSSTLTSHDDLLSKAVSKVADVDDTATKKKSKPSQRKRTLIVSRKEGDTILDKCDERLRDRFASVLNAVISEAEAGNMQATKFLFDRLLPDPRDRRLNFDFREINNINDAVGAWGDVFAGMSQGKITLKEAQLLGGLLKNYIDAAAALNKTMPKFVNKEAILYFVKEDEARFISTYDGDRETYSVFRQDKECEADFQKRAEAELRQRFPQAEVAVFSLAAYQALFPEKDTEDDDDSYG